MKSRFRRKKVRMINKGMGRRKKKLIWISFRISLLPVRNPIIMGCLGNMISFVFLLMVLPRRVCLCLGVGMITCICTVYQKINWTQRTA